MKEHTATHACESQEAREKSSTGTATPVRLVGPEVARVVGSCLRSSSRQTGAGLFWQGRRLLPSEIKRGLRLGRCVPTMVGAEVLGPGVGGRCRR